MFAPCFTCGETEAQGGALAQGYTTPKWQSQDSNSVLAEFTGAQNLCSQTEIVTSGETQDVEPGPLGQVRNRLYSCMGVLQPGQGAGVGLFQRRGGRVCSDGEVWDTDTGGLQLRTEGPSGLGCGLPQIFIGPWGSGKGSI